MVSKKFKPKDRVFYYHKEKKCKGTVVSLREALAQEIKVFPRESDRKAIKRVWANWGTATEPSIGWMPEAEVQKISYREIKIVKKATRRKK